jgi:hypothetical protein
MDVLDAALAHVADDAGLDEGLIEASITVWSDGDLGVD